MPKAFDSLESIRKRLSVTSCQVVLAQAHALLFIAQEGSRVLIRECEPAVHGTAALHAVHDVRRRGDHEPHPAAALAARSELRQGRGEALALRLHEAMQPLTLRHPQRAELFGALGPQRGVLDLKPQELDLDEKRMKKGMFLLQIYGFSTSIYTERLCGEESASVAQLSYSAQLGSTKRSRTGS